MYINYPHQISTVSGVVIGTGGISVSYLDGIWSVDGAGVQGEETSISGIGGVESTKVGDTWYVDGTTLSGSLMRSLFGNRADVYLRRSDSTTISLEGLAGTNKQIWVMDSLVSIETTKTLVTNSVSEFVVSGTGVGTVVTGVNLASYTDFNYIDHGVHYLYLCNNNDCWNFSGYDRRNNLILSPDLPTEPGGYLSITGEGSNARHVGWCITGAGTMGADSYVASSFNTKSSLISLGGKRIGYTGATAWWNIVDCDSVDGTFEVNWRAVVPSGWLVEISIIGDVQSTMADVAVGYGEAQTVSSVFRSLPSSNRYYPVSLNNYTRVTSDTSAIFKSQMWIYGTYTGSVSNSWKPSIIINYHP